MVRTIWWGGRSFAAFALAWPAGLGWILQHGADAPHTASTTTPSAAKQTRIPQRFSTEPTKTVKNAPESPIAAPLTPVASPLRLAYHFWAQASTAGAKKGAAYPRRDAVHQKEQRRIALRHQRCPHAAAAQQRGTPQGRIARAVLILHKTAQWRSRCHILPPEWQS